MDMMEYTKHLHRMNYAELLNEKSELDAFIQEYENEIPEDDPRWQLEEDPDIQYYYSLLKMKQLYGYLADAYVKDLEQKVLAKSRTFNANAILFTDPVEEIEKKQLTQEELEGLITK